MNKSSDSLEFQNAVQNKNDELNLLALSDADRGMKVKCSEEVHTKELAKVGPYLTKQVDINTYCQGNAHPGDSHEFRTIDTRGGRQMDLRELFKKDDIYSALMNDKIVQYALSSTHAKPKNFDELEAVLGASNGLGIGVFKERPGKPPLDIYLNKNMFRNFSFHHLEENKIAVRLLPDYGSEISRNVMTQLGIALPVPAALKNAFRDAEQAKKGFLMKDSAAKGKETFSEREYTEDW